MDTGVFTACITANDTDGENDNNGTLYASAGDQLTVSYVDPNDAGDTSNDTATVVNPGAAGVSIGKTLVAPADGIALVGDTVRFEIQVSNAGNVTLTNVVVTDTFSSCLTYQTATPAPDITSTTVLTWNTLGSIDVGGSKSIEVTFSANSACDPGSNVAEGDATEAGPKTTPPVEFTVTRPEVTVSKTKLAPAGNTATVGDLVTYSIALTNTGTTTSPNSRCKIATALHASPSNPRTRRRRRGRRHGAME